MTLVWPGRSLPSFLFICAGLSDLPEQKVLQIGEFTLGLTHGHLCMPWGDPEALAALQRQLDVDILITGHTHKTEVYEYEKKYIINPVCGREIHSGDADLPCLIIRGLTCVCTLFAHRHVPCICHFISPAFPWPLILFLYVFVGVQGSATGAYSAFSSGVVPSFVLMAIKGSKVVTYVYELRDGEVNVSKSEFIKQKHK